MTQPSRRTKRRGTMVGLVVALLALLAGPAAGTVVESGHYSGSDSFSFDDCGFWLDVEETFSGHFRVRADRDGEAFYGKDTFSFRSVFTNRDTEEWFVIRGHGVFNEIKATLVSGTIREGDETIVMKLAQGPRYIVEGNDTLTFTLVDDEGAPGPEPVTLRAAP